MHIVFRTDASVRIGNGHVMRCITLASKLRSNGCHIDFVCRQRNGDLIEKIKSLDFNCHALPFSEEIDNENPESLSAYWMTDAEETLSVLNQSPEWLVVDHYALDWEWEKQIQTRCSSLLVIDDLANRQHDCTILVDHNIGRITHDYESLVNNSCTLLLGPQYALIKDEFACRQRPRPATNESSDSLNVLISMGGVDKLNLTTELLNLLKDLDLSKKIRISIILGPYSPWNQNVIDFLKTYPLAHQVFIDPSNIAALVSVADMAIGTCGVSALERCSLQIPSINFIVAENQLPGGIALEKLGACQLIKRTALWEIDFIKAMHDFMDDTYRSTMQQSCAHVIDGQGTQKIAEAMRHGN